MEQEQESTFTKDDVVNAVLFVCKRVPGWYPTKEWIEYLYDNCADKLEGKTFDEQINAIGDRVRWMYFHRRTEFFDGSCIGYTIFRRDAEEFIRLIWWSKSFANRYMTDLLNHPIVL